MSKQGAIIRIDTSDRIKVSQESGLNMQFEFVGRPMAGVAGNEGEATHLMILLHVDYLDGLAFRGPSKFDFELRAVKMRYILCGKRRAVQH